MSKRFYCDKRQVTVDRQMTVDGIFAAPKFTFEKDENKAQLIFTPEAYIKMRALVDEFSTEVQWHGLVKRIDDFTFMVTDILIFPHEAAAATVVSDEKEYQEWLDALDADDFNSLRFHGHSHVNMAITPSGVDNTYRKNILTTFGIPKEGDDYFYIFLITNKRCEYNIQIFDITNNSLFDYKDKEITVTIMTNEDDDLNTFISEAKRIVTTSKPKTSYQYQQPTGGKKDYKPTRPLYASDWEEDDIDLYLRGYST